tara:strand:- start:7 stop:306 length:300 start_codon:yes stop_codon:yes gene_type:complete
MLVSEPIGSNSSCRTSLTVCSFSFTSSSGFSNNSFCFFGSAFFFSFFREENNSSILAIFFSDLATLSFVCFFSSAITEKKSTNFSVGCSATLTTFLYLL